MNDEDIARMFLKDAQVGDSIESMLNNDSRMNLGIDPENNSIVLTIGNQWEKMDPEFAELVSDALLMAVKTLKALNKARYN